MRNSVLFDLDGTLWDATGSSSPIWNRVLDKYGIGTFRMTQEISAGLMGKTMEEIGLLLFPDLPEETRKRVVDEFSAEEVLYLRDHGGVLYDGVEETLRELKESYDLYIVSNCQDGYVPAFQHAHHLEDLFRDIEMSGRTGLDKGSNIRLLMERNGIQNAVYVGDTEGDEKAARAAGIPFLWAEYGFGKALQPDGIIRAIHELPGAVSALFGLQRNTLNHFEGEQR